MAGIVTLPTGFQPWALSRRNSTLRCALIAATTAEQVYAGDPHEAWRLQRALRLDSPVEADAADLAERPNATPQP